ncbi:MAG: methylated-DNA--[protein]-cysteine S-methyltransferase, partial [Sphingobacteriales bacterium]
MVVKIEEGLQHHFPNATFVNNANTFHKNALLLFQNDWSTINTIQLHVRGTAFQLKVWEALLKIPMGQFATYGAIASQID